MRGPNPLELALALGIIAFIPSCNCSNINDPPAMKSAGPVEGDVDQMVDVYMEESGFQPTDFMYLEIRKLVRKQVELGDIQKDPKTGKVDYPRNFQAAAPRGLTGSSPHAHPDTPSDRRASSPQRREN